MKKIIVLIVALVLLVTVGTVGASAAERYGAFEYYVSDGEAHILRCHDNMGGTVVFPDTIEGCKVVSISGDVFDYGKYDLETGSVIMRLPGVKSVTLPVGINVIEPSTFEDMTELEEVVVPDGVWRIGDYAFSNCSSLKEITLSATTIEKNAFLSCEQLSSVTLNRPIAKLGDGVFAGCRKLTELTLCAGQSPIVLEHGVFVDAYELGPRESTPNLNVTIYGDVFDENESFLDADCFDGNWKLHIFAEYGTNAEWYAMITENVTFEPIGNNSFLSSYHFWSWVGLIVAVLLVLLLIFLVIRRIRKKRKLKKQQKEGTCTEQQADWQFGFQEPDTVVGQAFSQSDSLQTVERAPTESPAATMRYCGKCGTQNLDTAAFCRQCGQSMAHK